MEKQKRAGGAEKVARADAVRSRLKAYQSNNLRVVIPASEPESRNESRQARAKGVVSRMAGVRDSKNLLTSNHKLSIVRVYIRKINPRHYSGMQKLARSLALAFMAGIIALSILIPVLTTIIDHSRYQLSNQVTSLLGEANTKLASKITYDAKTASYYFNKDGIKTGDDSPAAKLSALTGGGDKKSKNTYSVQLPEDPSKGITYYDNNLELSFSMVPDLKLMGNRQVDDRLLYPGAGGIKDVFTAKNNGLKDDIVLTKPVGDSVSYRYSLNLPSTLQARTIDGTGEVGIYSADPTLFNNITFGSDADQNLVQKARENGAKNNLVFVLPPPVVKQYDKKTGKAVDASAQAEFVLSKDGKDLWVNADGLGKLSYPVTLDPSVVVTSTSDFATGNNEGNIDYPSNQINRGALTGGSISAGWTRQTSMFPNERSDAPSVVYNGYLYVVGGFSNGPMLSDIVYCPLNSNGSVGACTDQTSALPATRGSEAAVAYNGYLYISGGEVGVSGTDANDILYCPLNSNGSVGSCTQKANAFTNARHAHTSVVYNGYLYIIGGQQLFVGSYNDIQYCPLNADGSVGTCTTNATSFTNARFYHSSIVYNGYLYIIGGSSNGCGGGGCNDIQYCPLNSNGSVGSCTDQTNAFTTGRQRFGAAFYNGYLYIIGGFDGGTTYYNDVQYCPINANGSAGSCSATASFTFSRYGLTAAAYNGYLYLAAGFASVACTPNSVAYCADIQYAKIDPAGVLSSWTTTTSLPQGTAYGATVAYNGYLFVIGGYGGSGCTIYNTVYRSQINSTTGGLGSWSAATALPQAREEVSAVVYNGYMYVLGGADCGTTGYTTVWYNNLGINGGTMGPTWNTTTVLPSGRYGADTVVANGYIYEIGGNNTSGTAQTTVYYALLCTALNNGVGGCTGTPGTVGTWNTTTVLPAGTFYGAAVVYGGYMYMFGVGAAPSTAAYYALICTGNNSGTGGCGSTAGTVGTWNSATTLSAASYQNVAFAYKGYMYAQAINTTTFYVAPINTNGSLGSWTQTTSFSSSTGYSAGGAVPYDGNIYYLGGAYVTTTGYAAINNGGLGTSGATTTSSSFITARDSHTTVAYNGYLYLIGGWHSASDTACTTSANQYCADVQYAPLSSSGSIGAWHFTHNSTDDGTTFVAGLPAPRSYHSSVAYNGYLYVLGGSTNGTYQNSVYYAPINTNGTVGAWSTTSSFINGRHHLTSLAYNGYMYIIGGCSQTFCATVYNDVQFAPINSNGTLGAWHYTHNSTDDSTTFVAGFTTPRSGHTTLVYSGYIYLIGGTDSAANILNDVQYAPLNSNGTVGTWNLTSSLGVGIEYPSSFTYNGYIYITGGQGANGIVSDIQYAAINANGTLDTWSDELSAFTTARISHASVVYNGYFYVIGGTNGSDFSDTQYVPLNVIPRVGQYSKFLDFGSATNSLTGISYSGTLPNGISSISYRTAGSGGTFGSLQSASSLSGGGACASGTDRYAWVSITLDDSQVGVFPDVNGTNNANVTDMTVSYTAGAHPQPNIRLRLGQTLQSGTLSPLDTCYP